MSYSDLITATDRATQDHLGGVTATYTPDGGAAVLVVGMFDENFVLNDPERPGVEMVAPVFTARIADFITDPLDDDDPDISILGVAYTVEQRITDGTIGGSVRLLLHKAVA